MTAPLAIDMQSGAFTVPVTTNTPPFRGAGFQDTTPRRAQVYMDEEPTGQIYPLLQTFEVDFVQSSYGWTVEVHLEGDYEPAP